MAADVIVFLGPTGSGKSVQAKRLAKERHWAHISTGELVRADNRPDVIAASNAGELAPSDYVQELVGQRLSNTLADQPVILDGLRTMDDVRWLEEHLPELNRRLGKVILLDLDRQTAHERTADRGRADDSNRALARKWSEYEQDTMPVIDHYRDLGILSEVDGRRDPETVAKNISQLL